jgi:hypothetical protein
MLAIKHRTVTSTGISPFFLTHGYNVDILGLANKQEELHASRGSLVARGEAFVARLKEAVHVAQATMATTQELQEEYAN